MRFTLTRHASNPILEANPKNSWEAGSVFNPGILKTGDHYTMLYRATNDVKVKEIGGYTSSVGLATSTDGIHFTRQAEPLIAPTETYEENGGCEDARVTEIDGTYYIYYTAVRITKNELAIRTALATTKDFKTVTKHGVVGPAGSPNKASCLLPETVNDKYIMYFTWLSDSPLSSIMSAQFNSLEEVLHPPQGAIAKTLEYYDDHAVLRPHPQQKVFRGPELGAAPIKTDAGWLLIYSGANHTDAPLWTINAALLSLEDPTKVIARLPEPILSPETASELSGVVNNVTFPSGAIVKDDELYVYYGSGDQGICLATCKLADLLTELQAHPANGND